MRFAKEVHLRNFVRQLEPPQGVGKLLGRKPLDVHVYVAGPDGEGKVGITLEGRRSRFGVDSVQRVHARLNTVSLHRESTEEKYVRDASEAVVTGEAKTALRELGVPDEYRRDSVVVAAFVAALKKQYPRINLGSVTVGTNGPVLRGEALNCLGEAARRVGIEVAAQPHH